MRKKREEPREWPTVCIQARSPNIRPLKPIHSRFASPPPDYHVYSNETNDTVWVDPNSPEWFHWLDELASFSFSGNEGEFLASKRTPTERGEPTYWIASQQWGDREYKRDLGQTTNLTTSHLEEIAADMEAEISEKEIGGTGESDLLRLFLPAWKGPGKRGWKSISYRCFLIHQLHSQDVFS